MSGQMTTIEVAPKTAELLKAKAAARQLSLDEYLQFLAAQEATTEPEAELAPEQRARRWEEWVIHNSVRMPFHVDDSRESIYTREDEAL